MLDERPGPVLRRLLRWLTPFKACFGHRAESVSLAGYVSGLLSDSPRKSMQAMLRRVTGAPAYHAVQHFITNAPWSAPHMWRVLRAELPERRGLLLLCRDGLLLRCGRGGRAGFAPRVREAAPGFRPAAPRAPAAPAPHRDCG